MEFRDIDKIQPGQYYHLRSSAEWEADRITSDRMYLVTEFRHGTISLMGIFPESESDYGQIASWTFAEDEFFENFEFSQEASDQRQRFIGEVLDDAHKPLDQELGDIVSEKLKALHSGGDQMLLEGPQSVNAASCDQIPSCTTDLATTAQERAALVQRDQIAEIRSLVQKKKDELAKRNRRMELAIKEKSALMKAKMEGMMVMIRSMQYMVNAMNVYLGIGEEFGIIREGERAKVSEKLVVRQLVLCADEECALQADTGGIDFRDFQTFISWMIAKPERIQQIVPEPKVIVAMQMRRENKQYSDDPMLNAKMNEDNKRTWFIIRNGESLYYVWPEFNVHERLFPTASELDKIFMEEHLFDSQERPIRPGEHRWVEAVDKADAKRKQMMIGLLFLQGLVDRTDVFSPFADQARPNLADPADHDKHIIYRRDAEMILHDGRPSWSEYQKTINSRLRVGCRVVGNWPINARDEEPRCNPAYNRPDSGECYTIHRSDRDGHYFKFEIGYYSSSDYANKTRNISWQIKDYDYDRFINIDEVTEEDLMYYMTDRVNRKGYMDMFPVFNRALDFLRREREEEKPFRMLVAGEIAKKYNTIISYDDKQLDMLVNWWKFKNKFRRAIGEDDAKALRMIVQRFGQFFKRSMTMERISNFKNELVERIRSNYSRTLFIGADDNGRLTAFVACYEDRNVWYKQHFFDWSGKEDTEPKLLADPWNDAAYPMLYSSERWKSWGKWDNGSLTLTDEDQDFFVAWANENLPAVADRNRHRYHSHPKPPKGQHPGACFRLLAAVQHGAKIIFWIQDHAYCNTHEGSEPTVSYAEIKWERKGHKKEIHVVVPGNDYDEICNYSRMSFGPGAEAWRGRFKYAKTGRPFWIDKDAEEQWHQDYAKWKSACGDETHDYSNLVRHTVSDHYSDIRYTWMKKYAAHLRSKYIERAMGDAEQCEMWIQKELEKSNHHSITRDGVPLGPHLHEVMEAIDIIAYKGIDEHERRNCKEVYEKVLSNLAELRSAKTLRDIFVMTGVKVNDETWKGPESKGVDNIPFLDEPIEWGDYSQHVAELTDEGQGAEDDNEDG